MILSNCRILANKLSTYNICYDEWYHNKYNLKNSFLKSFDLGTHFSYCRLYCNIYLSMFNVFRFEDPEVKKDMSMVSYKIVKASNGDAWVKATDGKVRTALIVLL